MQATQNPSLSLSQTQKGSGKRGFQSLFAIYGGYKLNKLSCKGANQVSMWSSATWPACMLPGDSWGLKYCYMGGLLTPRLCGTRKGMETLEIREGRKICSWNSISGSTKRETTQVYTPQNASFQKQFLDETSVAFVIGIKLGQDTTILTDVYLEGLFMRHAHEGFPRFYTRTFKELHEHLLDFPY